MKITRNLKDRRRLSRKDGFSLIEIMLVIGLIVVLLSAVVFNFDALLGSGEVGATQAKISSLETALVTYRTTMGKYPSTEEGLKALLEPPSGAGARWRGPYVNKSADIKDAWDKPFNYKYPGTHNRIGYDLYSHGPDQVESADDITNWETAE